jgi:hypothetical protein
MSTPGIDVNLDALRTFAGDLENAANALHPIAVPEFVTAAGGLAEAATLTEQLGSTLAAFSIWGVGCSASTLLVADVLSRFASQTSHDDSQASTAMRALAAQEPTSRPPSRIRRHLGEAQRRATTHGAEPGGFQRGRVLPIPQPP